MADDRDQAENVQVPEPDPSPAATKRSPSGPSRTSSSSPACPARAAPRPSTRSRTSATSASTTCRRRCMRAAREAHGAAGQPRAPRRRRVRHPRPRVLRQAARRSSTGSRRPATRSACCSSRPTTATLVNRFKATRRRHPLGDERRRRRGHRAGARRAARRPRARRHHHRHVGPLPAAAARDDPRAVHARGPQGPARGDGVSSFGFKYGLPIDADIVMDVRFLPNPYYKCRAARPHRPERRRARLRPRPRGDAASSSSAWFELLAVLHARLPGRGQDAPLDRHGLHRRHAPQRRARRARPPTSCARWATRSPSAIATWARTGRAGERPTRAPSRSAAAPDSRECCRACSSAASTRPRSSRWPTTAAPPGSCAASSASCRPVTRATASWRWRTPDSPLARVFQYRFAHGEGLAGHALGNLDHRRARRHRGRLPRGARRPPASCSARAGACCRPRSADVVLVARDWRGRPHRGPGRRRPTATSRSRRVHLEPAGAAGVPARARGDRRRRTSSWSGPGASSRACCRTSSSPASARRCSRAPRGRIYVCNVANQRGETGGHGRRRPRARAHRPRARGRVRRRARARHASATRFRRASSPSSATTAACARSRRMGPRVVLGDLVDRGRPAAPRPRELLCRALGEVMLTCPSPPR